MAHLRRSLHVITISSLMLAGVMAAGRVDASAAVVSDPAALVNPFIGTANAANDFPGADSPFGMVQWSPDTRSAPDGGGYAYGDSSITGFGLTHVAGPGCRAGGDLPVLPTVGAVNTGATVGFSHSNESASPGAYTVKLDNGVSVELTTTTRSGMARFTFPSSAQSNLIFKLAGGQSGGTNTQFTKVSDTEVTGQVTAGHFCGAAATYTAYFDMVFDRPFSSSATAAVQAPKPSTPSALSSPNAPERPNHPALHGAVPKAQTTTATAATNGYVVFDTRSNPVVQAKVGLSFVSVANAAANRAAENTSWDFNGTRTKAHNAWNAMLGRIGVAGGTSDQQHVFYTALYHSLLHPNVFSDTNGQYVGLDGKVHTVGSGHSAEYATFSGWDIYRSQAQLSALVAPAVASDIAQSAVDDYQQSGMFPKWNLNNGETYVMVGDPADSIIADYYAFGARNFDTATALRGMVAQATTPNNIRPGLADLERLGYLPSDHNQGCCNFYGPTSTTLEYGSADAAISFFAGALGDSADQKAFINRAQDWRNLFNYASGFIQPRTAAGAWMSGFDPTSGSTFVEGDSWQYTPMVPYNLRGLADAKGGNAAMISFLDTDLADLTGANGHTDLTNEPSLNIPWEYDYVGAPYKTQAVVRRIQDQIWTNAPGGLAGNDDLGTMSAWYVFSALGMYPETPGTADLALGSPLFTQAVITLPSGNTLTINGNGAADKAPYVQSASWNGAPWNNAYAPTSAITSGGTLTFTLGTSANTSWASGPSAAPPSYPGTPSYSNVGISSDSARSAADFDGAGNSYSASALATAGIQPGSTVKANGISFTWPNVPAGQPDNYLANGQTVSLSGSGSISFLGSASNGSSTGTATVRYTDGSSQSIPVTFGDWTLNGGNGSVPSGDSIAITTPYRNKTGGSTDNVKTYLYATNPVSLASGKTVASLRLPSNVNAGGLHVFAIATGSVAGVHTGPIVAGVSSSLCVDDLHSQAADGNTIQTWTCNGTNAQDWTVAANGTLTIFGKCLDIAGAGTANGTKIDLWTCNGGANQVWKPGSNGSLVNPATGKCLDDPNSSTTPGTQLQLYTCNGTNAQRWTLP